MNPNLKEKLLDYLTNREYGVQSIIDCFDWLGTGSSMKLADQEQREAQERLDSIIKLIQEE